MAGARAWQQAVIALTMRTIGFDRAFRDIRKGSKDSESALQKMAGGLASATEGSRSFVKEGVAGALEMSTRLRRMNVVMGGTADKIEGLRKEQAQIRVETGMTAEEADRLRMGLVEIGDTSLETALKAANMTKALQLDPETTVQWFGLGKQMKMTATQTENMMQETAGLMLAMKVDPTKFFKQSAELADIMRTRMLALGKQGPEAIARFMKGGAALTAMMSKAGFGTDEAAAAMTQYAQQSADAMFDIRKMTAGLSSTELPELVKMTSISMGSFTDAVAGASKAPDVLLGQLAQMTADLRAQGKDMTNWTAFVEQSVGDKRLAQLIVNNTDSVIQANKLAAGATSTLTARYKEVAKAELESAENLRKMRDEQVKVLKESIAVNAVFKLTNPLVELQTKALGWLTEEYNGLNGVMKMGVGGSVALAGVIGEGAEKLSNFAIQSANTAKALHEMREAAPALGKQVAKHLPTFTRWGKALFGIGKAAKLGVDNLDVMAEYGLPKAAEGATGLAGGFAKLAGKITGQAVPSFGAAILALGPLLIALTAIAAIFGGLYAAISAYATAQEKAGQAALDRANKETQAIVKAKKAADARNDQILFESAQMKNLSARIKELQKERGEFDLLRGTIFGGQTEIEIDKEIERLKGFQARSQERIQGMQQTRAPGSTAGASLATPLSHSPTPVTPSSAFPPGAQMTRVAIQSLEEQRSQVGLLEQLVALMGGLPGAMTPPMAGGGGGGGGVNVTIRPDSGRMQLHKMLEVDARNQLGRAGYTQLGGLTHTA